MFAWRAGWSDILKKIYGTLLLGSC
ncbi:hypothetical protein FP2506_16909 [Fulvimarina pelagi HTCC2506]|uniref:Uncharacterized protein n=1 Tax=Fulvimarina pelagi HTCC2506 TaxID=314231 RepID=Q0G2P8_9HYPH|nr:hypothetical protein FP2506_16909 [Fulvimarina pelagi HTCC2506]